MANKFTLLAAARGAEFALRNPSATGPEIDAASPIFNPARTAFQNAAYAQLAAQHPAHWRGHRYDEDGICRCGAQIEDTWFTNEER